MTEQIIGKVMMTFKGDYDTTKQYNFLDTVEYNGSSFVCKANGTHDTPSEQSANWQLLAKAGRDGKDGINGKDGAPGKDGKDGAPGKNGKDGAQGVAGKDGKDGKDAIDTLKTITTGTLSSLGTGNYEIDFAAEDAPSINWGVLQVLVGTHYAQQIFSNAGATNGASQTWIRTRNYDESNYDAWQEVSLPNTTDWSTVGVSLLDGTVQASDNQVRYRVITLGKIHRVEVTGWVTTTIVGGRFNSKVRIPRMGFENATKMSFSGGATLSAYGDIVSFFAGQPGEINLFSGAKTLENANFQINCHWIYEE